jgi:Co/Zn/Cd efflux system component
MTDRDFTLSPFQHSHVFLGAGHDRNARKTWAVIWLCGAMMAAEIIGGSLFGSLALIADGLHMSTHAGALLLAALAYSYARHHAEDSRFAFGTGKLGDLAGFSSAIILAMIALLIGYEAVGRLLHPIAISFDQALPIAVVGLMVNVASAWLLSGDDHHHHGHGHGDANGDGHAHHEEVRRIDTGDGTLLSKFSAAELVQFDTTITDIHKFEKIRYPDGLSEQGGLLFIEWDKDSPQDSLEPWFPTYKINAIQIDYLVLKIFEVSSSNLSLCMSTLKYNPHVREILTRYNPVGTQILGD